MNDIETLFKKYKNKGLLIDTNILLLLIIGITNRDRISKFNRTENFTSDDYDLLLDIINKFSHIITTPNILTEINSLINGVGEPERSKCVDTLAKIINTLNENYLQSQEVVKNDKFIKFGLTDCGIMAICQNKYLVLTDDLKLSNYLQSINIDVINFNHLRFYDEFQN
ncbi:MAG TPA: PIN domain-containing protein [Allocoleopsis sp.]